MFRYVLAPINADAARALSLPRTLPSAAGVAITFDDGPHPEGTPAILDILAAGGVKASFFLIGEQVERRPELAARIVAEGHLVALHGYRHRLQPRLSSRALTEDIRRGAAVIHQATGRTPEWHRPPYGIYSPAGLRAAREAGLRPLLWSRWGKDWRKFTTAERIARRATRAVLGGDVILLHDADFYSAKHSHRHTVAALGPILTELSRRKLDTVLPV